MSKILIIGNVLKDVYLKLDERRNKFERDQNGIGWMNLGFNGESHAFFQRSSIYGGAAVTLETLSRLGIDTRIMGSNAEFKSGQLTGQGDPANYRYIFCHDGEITYFVPSERKITEWTMPKDSPEWILVDRSAMISERLVDELKNFRKFSPTTKLAVYLTKNISPLMERLAEMADLLFVENEPPVHQKEEIVDKIDLGRPDEQLKCYISPRKIVFGESEESWQLDRTNMMTHLTVYNMITATILGVIVAGGTTSDAVLWAKLNAEHTTLENALSARRLKELAEAEKEKRADIALIAKSIMAPRKGVLAADESEQTLTERLVEFGIGANSRTRTEYRKLLLTTPELKDYASGVILTEQTAKEKVQGRQTYLDYLTSRGIVVGVKADQGQAHLPGTDETYTLGEKNLAGRLRGYYDDGFRFAKWNAKFEIAENKPSYIAIEKAAELLASFARECQLSGLLPMIEVNISHDGDYSIKKSIEVTDRILINVFDKLERRRVDLSKVILKVSMVSGGAKAVEATTSREVGIATAAVLKHAVPRQVAGILLLSGGIEAKVATENLSSVIQSGPFDWPVSFAFGRALQYPVMATWKGKTENEKAAQAALRRHLQDNTAIIRG